MKHRLLPYGVILALWGTTEVGVSSLAQQSGSAPAAGAARSFDEGDGRLD